nr:MAG TPA: hypothetical protein [Bacteriophage sp.]DAY54689.1 MAG TPA: hypothetical protein [Caudoviricetes sp.]
MENSAKSQVKPGFGGKVKAFNKGYNNKYSN